MDCIRATVGMESMFDKVWSWLADDEVRIMGLYGYGGVGKTTLLKQINNAFLKTSTSSTTTTHGFDVVILVVVSEVINIDAIQKKIGNRLGLSSTDRRSIFNALTKKRFVLLLDDIWKTIDLQSIGVPPLENNKSKVIFTTRSETVCRHMDANIKFRVECLPWDEAWTLFQEKVGNETLNSHPKVLELAKIVAKECSGLPLSLITIGRAMSSKRTVREWNHAITILRESASDFPGMSEEVLPILKRSYDSLHNDTFKSCFLYCALFREGESINKATVVDYWIGEGFISLSEFNNLDDARNHGYDVIGDLKGASLLESGENEETEVKMHDTFRDLALWIAHECGNKMCIIDTSDLTTTPETPERSWYDAERICLIRPPPHRNGSKTKVRIPPLKSPKLITLILQLGYLFFDLSLLPRNFFEFTPLLRVLDLSYTQMETFPISITELLELRYLSISNTFIRELPKELGKLVKLNYLDLSNMKDLKKIPSGVIGNLVELRVLNFYETPKVVDWDFDEVDQLKHLNDLGITIVTQQNLNKLLSSSCFQKLTQIVIKSCNGLKDLTWVGYVPNLKALYVGYCEEIIIVVDDDLGGGLKGGGTEIIFQSLNILRLWALPKLKSICRNALAFPCLELMEVVKCPELKKLPFDSGSNVNNNLRIAGVPKWWSELLWEEEDHNNNNNNNKELLKSKFLPYY